MANNSVMPPSFQDLQDAIDYHFQNSRYLLEALRTAGAGYHTANAPSTVDGNKRLAHLGEAVLRLLLLEDWYMAGANRESANAQITRVASTAHLCLFADHVQLSPCILTNPSQWNQTISPGVKGKSVQALVGAIWLDSDHDLSELRRVLHATDFWNVTTEVG